MTKYIPRCSCIICKEEKSYKGIHSHFLSMHTDADTKTRIVGNGNRKSNSATTKQKAVDRINEYNKNPKYCAECKTTLSYTSRHNRFCNHSCSAIYNNTGDTQSNDTKQKISEWAIANPRGFYKTYLDTGEFKPGGWFKSKLENDPISVIPYTKISYCIICNKCFEGHRKTCSNKCLKIINRKNGGFKPNSTKVHRSMYKGFQMDSGAELVFAQICDLNNVAWIKNKDTFFDFIYPDGKSGKYYPDFYLPHINRWIEIKGRKYVREHDSVRQASANAILIMSDKLKDKEFILNIINGNPYENQTRLSD